MPRASSGIDARKEITCPLRPAPVRGRAAVAKLVRLRYVGARLRSTMRLETTKPRQRSSVLVTRSRARGLGLVLVAASALASAIVPAGLAGCGSDGCGGSSSQPEPVAPAPAPLTQPAPAPVVPAAPAEPTSAEPAAESGDLIKPGWSKIAVDQEVPICVFPSYAAHFEAKFLKDVKKQSLRADNTLVVGAFGPWCVNEGCDDVPSLQCFAERSGNTINVRTHYWGLRKDASSCEGKVCRPVSAGCETPKLEAGTYTIVHGDKSYKLKIPSTLRSPCFGKELTPPGA